MFISWHLLHSFKSTDVWSVNGYSQSHGCLHMNHLFYAQKVNHHKDAEML